MVASPGFASDPGETITHSRNNSLRNGLLVKRVTALALGVMIAGLAALGVIPGTVSAASAIEDYDTGSWFEENVAAYFQYNWGDGEDTIAAMDKIDSWLWGDGTVCAVFPDGPGGPGGEQCEDVQSMFVPSPGKVGAIFATKPAATGVTVNSGGATNSVLGGLLADLTGVSAGTVRVDPSATDLTAAPPGTGTGWQDYDYSVTMASGVEVEIDLQIVDRVATVYAHGVGMPVLTGTTSEKVGQYNAWSGNSFATVEIQCFSGVALSTSFNGSRMASGAPGVKDCSGLGGVMVARARSSHISPAPWTETWSHDGPVAPAGGFVGSMESTYVCRTSTGATNTHTRSVEVDSAEEYVDVSLERFSCPASELLLSALVEWVTDSGREVVFDYDAPEWVHDTPAEWQLCGELNCELRLYSGTQYCGQYAVGCPEWFENPDEFTCKFGPYVVDIAHCAMYRKPGEVRPTGRVTVDEDGNLHHERGLDKEPEWFRDLDRDFDSINRPVPPPDVEIIAPGVGDASSDRSKCFPTGWGILNPLEWVYRPTTCALSWAFVPKTGVAQFAAITTALAASPLGEVQGFFGGIVEGLQIEGRGCVTLVEGSPSAFLGSSFEVNTCDEWLVAAGPVARTGLGWLAILLGAFGAFAVVSAAFDVKSGIRSEGE